MPAMLLRFASSALLLAAPAAAAAPSVHVSGWARAGLSNSAAYLSVHNAGKAADRLLSVSTPAAASASVHTNLQAGGVTRMRAAGPLTIAPGTAIEMKPSGLHVMLTGLKAPLRPGTRLPLTLRFARAGSINVSLPVLPPGATGPSGDHHGH